MILHDMEQGKKGGIGVVSIRETSLGVLVQSSNKLSNKCHFLSYLVSTFCGMVAYFHHSRDDS